MGLKSSNVGIAPRRLTGSDSLHGFVVNGEVDVVLENLVVVMKPGGNVTIVEFKKDEEVPGPPFEDRLAPDDVEAVMARIGGIALSQFEPSSSHYAIVFAIRGELD